MYLEHFQVAFPPRGKVLGITEVGVSGTFELFSKHYSLVLSLPQRPTILVN